MAQVFWKQKKKSVFGLMLHLRSAKSFGTLSTNTYCNALRGEGGGGAAHGHGNNGCGGDVSAVCKQGRLKEALRVLHVLDQRGIQANSYTYVSILQVCLGVKALPQGKLVHAHIIQTGFNTDIHLGNKLVIMYAKCGSLGDARRVLEERPNLNVISWTTLITVYVRHGCCEEALTVFCQMQRRGIQPDHFTYASILPACANLEILEHGKQVHGDVIKRGFQSDVFVGSALVDMYAKCGSAEDAHQVFDQMPELNVVSWNAMIGGYSQNRNVGQALKLFQKMPERDVVSWNVMIAGCAQNGRVEEAFQLFQKVPERNVVSWNTMIAGYAQNGYFDEALTLFQQMQLTGGKPNSVTFASVLPACANFAALQQGKEIHEDIIRSGFQSDLFVAGSLVDMYAKCGSIDDARQVFDKMSKRDVVSWTAMIGGYAMHGCGKEALQLFEEMRPSGIKPNHATFVGVLSACCHSGLVDDGWQYFDCMSRDYHITPTAEHYCCMVDLLGRAGRLSEAHNFINKMPMKPNAAVWGSLLGACRIHTNIGLGERVAEHLFELDPKNPANYMLLANIYAAAGRWKEKEKVRRMMKDKRVKRMPGRSWIEINKKVYDFVVGDRSHPQLRQIYAELERLSGQMKEAGYVPDTDFVLHDVEDQQKECVLRHHSEKLAIAFGLINTSPRTPIRVVKNLRVCGDCHSAINFISKIVAREIVVRDPNRFHHFKGGHCSCGDYW